jgi:hypothetical protein
VWGLVLLLLQPAILSQYLDRGFRGGLNPVGVIHRARVHLALTLVVGVLVTFPYASFVGAYLSGHYARLTESPALRAEAIDR